VKSATVTKSAVVYIIDTNCIISWSNEAYLNLKQLLGFCVGFIVSNCISCHFNQKLLQYSFFRYTTVFPLSIVAQRI